MLASRRQDPSTGKFKLPSKDPNFLRKSSINLLKKDRKKLTKKRVHRMCNWVKTSLKNMTVENPEDFCTIFDDLKGSKFKRDVSPDFFHSIN